MTRLVTALVALPLALAAIFWLSDAWFFLAMVALVGMAVLEYARLGERLAAGVPLWVLLLAVPPVALGLCLQALGEAYLISIEESWLGVTFEGWLLFSAAMVPLGFGTLVLFSRAPLERSVAGLGLLAFGLPYFALPIMALTLLRWADPWLLLLMLVVVWAGDSCAYYLGTRYGRHKLAPVISPHKSWEGAAAGLAGSVLAALAFHLWRPESFPLALVPLAAVTGVLAQIGDLVESLLKRAAGVKDSGTLLPGHGGVLDRIDALLFAAPVWYIGLRLLGRLGQGG